MIKLYCYTNNKEKKKFIEEILKLKFLRGNLYYSVYENTNQYVPLVALAISKAVICKIKDCKEEYRANIIIDDLRKTDGDIIRKELKALNIHYNKIKVGLRDEQDVLLRFADAVAGFVRDYLEGERQAVNLVSRQKFNNLFRIV